MKLICIFLAFLLCSSASAQTKRTSKIFGNKVQFDTDLIDLGTVKANKKVTYRLRYKNISKESLSVREINNECSCFSTVAGSKTIPPGESSTIIYEFKNVVKGVISKKSFIIFNEFAEPVALTVKGKFI